VSPRRDVCRDGCSGWFTGSLAFTIHLALFQPNLQLKRSSITSACNVTTNPEVNTGAPYFTRLETQAVSILQPFCALKITTTLARLPALSFESAIHIGS
jgi:hypothetical protein